MVLVHTINIDPPLVNASCAWASQFSQLRELYDCPFTGAVITRTATRDGFAEDERHTVAFASSSLSTINSYGYSPHPLAIYLEWTYELLTHPTAAGLHPAKPVIISMTDGNPDVISEMVTQVHGLRHRLKAFHSIRPTLQPSAASPIDPSTLVAVEINTSCPNILHRPPTSYDLPSLAPILEALASSFRKDPTLTIGLKLPPYCYSSQFGALLDALSNHSCQVHDDSNLSEWLGPVAYIACTNTLGNCILFDGEVRDGETCQDPLSPALPTVLGGLAGEALHALALGNVYSFSQRVATHPDPAVGKLKIIGIGGVTNLAAVSRMQSVGAHIVGSATLFGQQGITAFELLTLS